MPLKSEDIAKQDIRALNKLAEQLRDGLKESDERLTNRRIALDSQARNRNYRAMEKTGGELIAQAKVADTQRADLDLVATELGKRSR